MGEFGGFILGIVFIATACGISSYYIWENLTRGEHTGKQVFFAFLCFLAGGATGIIGGLPTLILSYGFARHFRRKIQYKPMAPPHFQDKGSQEETKKVV